MTLQIDFWQLVMAAGALGAFVLSGYAVLSRMLLLQVEKRMDQRFEQHEKTGQAERMQIVGRMVQAESLAADHGERLARIEGGRSDGPTHQDLGEIHERINAMTRELSETRGEFAAARRMLETIHEYLLKGGR